MSKTYEGTLKIGTVELRCYVVPGKSGAPAQRLLSRRGVDAALLVARGDRGLPSLVSLCAGNLNVSASLDEMLANPVAIRTANKDGRGVTTHAAAHGYDAMVLPGICTLVLQAERAGVLPPQYKHVADRCFELQTGFAYLGITALVDEATGYQEDRERDELQKILDAYVSKELLPWELRFPHEFFRQMFRLRGWDFDHTLQGPRYAGKLVNRIIYRRMPEGVLEELRSKTPPADDGERRTKYHQHLTPDLGVPQLTVLVSSAIAMMRASASWEAFERYWNRAYPAAGSQMLLVMDEDE